MKFPLLAGLFVSAAAFGQYDPPSNPKPERCTLNVLIESDKTFPTGDQARDYCAPYEEYCLVRKYVDDSWESSLRVKRVFSSKNAREVMSIFDRFIRRNGLISDDLSISLKFISCED